MAIDTMTDPFGVQPAGASWLLAGTPGNGPVMANMSAPTIAAPSPPALLPPTLGMGTAPVGDAEAAKRAVLAKIASGEAHRYTEVYNGPDFADYSDHPRQRHVITEGPHKGETSDASGLYQFLSSTWDQQARKLGLKDFSPASQDVAAWDLAATTYKQTTGRDLLADAQAGKVDYSKLAGQWPSLPGRGEGGGGEGAVAARAARARAGGAAAPQGVAGAAPATIFNPDGTVVSAANPAELIAGQMKLTLLRNMFQKHDIHQVEYDPWKVMPGKPERVNVNEGIG